MQHALFAHTGLGHATIKEYKNEFADVDFDDFFKFAIVRNPWLRLLSAYSFLKSGGRNGADRHWSQVNLANISSFDQFACEWLSPERMSSIAHLQSQTSFVQTSAASLGVNYIGYFESLAESYAIIRRELITRGFKNIPATMDRYNAGAIKESDYRKSYSQAAIERVSELYGEDITNFGYSFEGPIKFHHLFRAFS